MNRLKISGALILGAALALPGISHAQTTPAKDGKTFTMDEIEIIETARIHVNNLASNVMAYWLDPLHQPMPVQIQMSERNAGNLYSMGIGLAPQPGNGNGPSGLKLPKGIQDIVSIDPQNVLRVRGTKAGIEALQKLVKEIDVPLKQVEIEVQIWEMSPNTLESLPLVFRDTAKTGNSFNTDFLSRIALAAPTSDIAPTTQILTAAIKTKFAHLIMAPRLTVIDGLVGTTQSNESRALLLNEKKNATSQAESKKQEETPPTPKIDKETFPEGIAFIIGQNGVTLAPVLHGDAMSLAFGITLDGSVTQAATTLRDGQTLAVRLPNANPTNGWMRVALIKARIIHRAGDNVIVPKT